MRRYRAIGPLRSSRRVTRTHSWGTCAEPCALSLTPKVQRRGARREHPSGFEPLGRRLSHLAPSSNWLLVRCNPMLETVVVCSFSRSKAKGIVVRHQRFHPAGEGFRGPQRLAAGAARRERLISAALSAPDGSSQTPWEEHPASRSPRSAPGADLLVEPDSVRSALSDLSWEVLAKARFFAGVVSSQKVPGGVSSRDLRSGIASSL